MEATIDSSRRVESWLEKPATVALLLVLLSGLLIRANFAAPFYMFDDPMHLIVATEDPLSESFSLSNEQTLLPISHLSLRLDRALFGPPISEKQFVKVTRGVVLPLDTARFKTQTLWSGGTRVINALYHAFAGFLLWLFLRRIGVSSGVALLVAAVWTAHPMACESVCWISERKNVLAALFGFGALLAWTAPPGRWWRWPLVTVAYLLSVFSKPTGVGFLPILIALEIIDPVNGSFSPRSARAWGLLAARMAAPIAVTLAVIWANMRIHAFYFVEHPGGSLWTALLTDVEIFARYVGNSLLPVNLSFFYGVTPIVSLLDARLWIYGAVLVAVCVLPIMLTEGASRRRAILGLLWFFAALGPTANIATIPYWMQDRYAYVSVAGLLLAVFEGVKGLASRVPQIAVVASRGVGVACVLLFAVLTFVRSPLFVNAETLHLDAAERQPTSGMAQLMAWYTYRARAEQAPQDGSPTPDPKQVENAKLAYFCMTRAMTSADLTNFKEAFEMRTQTAETMVMLNQPAVAQDCLRGWLPPPHLQPWVSPQEMPPAAMKSYFEPVVLSFAWMLMSEARLQQADPPKTSETDYPLDKRKRACEEAVIALQNATTVMEHTRSGAKNQSWRHYYNILNAKILLAEAGIEARMKDGEASVRHMAEARKLLNSVAPDSSYHQQAKQLLVDLK